MIYNSSSLSTIILFLRASWLSSVKEVRNSRSLQKFNQLHLSWRITWLVTRIYFNDVIDIFDFTDSERHIMVLNIITFKFRILTTPSMSKHPRIFNQQPHSSPLSSSTTSSYLVLDPFNNNYTLTGLVTHIDSSLGELIASKKSKEGKFELDR